jgi:hypothetical protein
MAKSKKLSQIQELCQKIIQSELLILEEKLHLQKETTVALQTNSPKRMHDDLLQIQQALFCL